MKKENLFLKSAQDSLDLYVTIFTPKGKPKGIVQFAHGMIEHQIYYYDFMEFLTNKGYITIINDHRGHGKSVKSDADLGYFYDNSANFIVEDLHQVTRYIKNKYKKLPVYLFGHSMGSLISLNYIKKYDNDIEKLIICGLPSNRHGYKIGGLFTKLYSLLRSDKYRSKTLNGLVLPKSDTNWLTTNMEYFKKTRKDKYNNFLFTNNGILNLTSLLKKIYSTKGWSINNKDLNILFIAGSDDKIIIGEKEWLNSINFIKNRGYKNIEYKLYKDCKHAVFKDNEKEVFKDVLGFIEKK